MAKAVKKQTKKVEEKEKTILEQLEIQLNDLLEETKDKKYLVAKDKNLRNRYIDFLNRDVKFTGMECAGVHELMTILEKLDENIWLDALAIQALYWFMKEHKGTGYKEAKLFIEIMKPITEAMVRVENDKNAINEIANKIEQEKLKKSIGEGVEEPKMEVKK